jgi:putative ABC transport system permease protein
MIHRLSLAVLRVIARIVPRRQRRAWLVEWESELGARRSHLQHRNALSRREEVVMFRQALGSFYDAAWLRRQFTRDADLVHDLRYGTRLIRRQPAFAALTIGVLALGIGATTAIFSVVDALLVRQLPYRNPERIVLFFEAPSTNRAALDGVAPANAIDWQAQAQSVDVMSAVEPVGFTYTGGSEPQSMPGTRVTKGFFEAFGVQPLYGRTFTDDEYTPGRNQVLVLSYGTWTQRFGGDPSIVGRVLQMNSQPYTVVGVMPATFAPRLLVTFSERGVWAPKVWADFERQLRGAHYFNVVGRLRPDVSIEQAQAEFEGIAERLATEYPRTNTGQTVRVVALRDHLAGGLRSSIGLLFGAVALLLVIAIANTANLLMARATARGREIAVRTAIGAGSRRLMRQLLAETLLLASAGCLLGFGVAHGAARAIVALAPGDIPGLAVVGLNWRVLLFSGALTGLVALLIGVLPAWKAAGLGATVSLVDASGGETTGARRRRGRTVFVVAELALALTLLAAGALLLRSFSQLLNMSPGFTADGVAALQIFMRGPNRTPAQRVAFCRQVIAGMRALPQVAEAGAVSVMPFLNTSSGSSTAVVIEGRAAPAKGDEPSAFITVATPGYFPVMRIPLLEGRIFTEHDNADRTPVAVISRTFAVRHWRDGSPIGQRIRFTLNGAPLAADVVGVLGDLRHDALDRPPNQEVFVPYAQVPLTGMTFVARTNVEPVLALGMLKSQIYAAVPNQAIYRTAIVRDLVSDSLNDRRFMLTLILAFAALAVTLAATGVYGVMNLMSVQRTREFGVRLALGAGRAEILRMVLREGAVIALVGIVLGLAGAIAAGQVLRRFLFGIGPTDLWTLAGVCLVLAIAAGIACLMPAIRATRVNPIVALRTD